MLDKKLLSLIQDGLPVEERPFAALAAKAKADPDDAMARLRRLREEGLIRRIGPIFDSARLGYVSTLAAAKVPPDRLDAVAAEVSRQTGVTHNYRREHAFNLWFTLTAPSPEALRGTLDDLRRQTGVRDIYSLTSKAVYKLKVHFALDGSKPQAPRPRPKRKLPVARLAEEQKDLVRLVQDDVAVTERPFDAVADRLGWPPSRVVEQLREWLAAGVIRRFGAVVNHRRLGFAGNGMAVFRVPPGECDRIGNLFAERPEVSHCYRRPPMPGWDYNLFAMVHGRSKGEVVDCVERMAAEAGLPEYDVLFSTTEYKKASMRYFLEDKAA